MVSDSRASWSMMTCGSELRFEWPLMLRLVGSSSTQVSRSRLHVCLEALYGEAGQEAHARPDTSPSFCTLAVGARMPYLPISFTVRNRRRGRGCRGEHVQLAQHLLLYDGQLCVLDKGRTDQARLRLRHRPQGRRVLTKALFVRHELHAGTAGHRPGRDEVERCARAAVECEEHTV